MRRGNKKGSLGAKLVWALLSVGLCLCVIGSAWAATAPTLWGSTAGDPLAFDPFALTWDTIWPTATGDTSESGDTALVDTVQVLLIPIRQPLRTPYLPAWP